MAGITDKGWETKTFEEILEAYVADANSAWGDVATTPDSVLGELFNIVAAPVKDLWELGKQVEDTQNRDSATGPYLDYLAELVGLSRQRETGAVGELLFTGKSGTTVVSNTAVKDSLDRFVLTNTTADLNRANCYQSTFTIPFLVDNTDYIIVVEGITSSVTSGTGQEIDEILESLKVILDINTEAITTVEDSTLVITYPSFNNQLTTTNSANIKLYSVGTLVSSESATKGDLDFVSDTITNLVTPNLGVYSVTNLVDFVSGRVEETDPDLRQRMEDREQSTGTATKPAIEASISDIAGVTNVLIAVNDTLEFDSVTGIPAKSFETFVTGGDDGTIAEVLWETKPALGVTHGTVERTILDRNGDTQSVKFSRQVEKYAWVRVAYTINSEEDFPSGGEEAMQSLVVTRGEDMYSGEDFAPTKFYGTLYTVQGVYISSLEVAVTDSLSDTPVYTTDIIPVSKTERLIFSEQTVTITTE